MLPTHLPAPLKLSIRTMKRLSLTSLATALVLGLAATASAHQNQTSEGSGGCSTGLHCDAGGPYVVASQPGAVTVQLNGSGSSGGTDFVWNVTYPGAYFNDASLPNPTLTIPITNGCSFDVPVQLLFKRTGASSMCSTVVRVRDREKPVIQCPELAKITSGENTSPEYQGAATATDNCDQNVTVTYTDKIVMPTCRAGRFAYQIERTWKAVDDDCNVAKCVQIIDVVRRAVNMDALPGTCPNLYDRNGCGSIPIAITGAQGFDASQIQWSSLRLWGFGCAGGPLAPDCITFGDVATPFPNGLDCNCTTANGDGKLDLVARFKRSRINNALGLANLPAGTPVKIIVTGKLQNGQHFIALDCLIMQ